jgi:hypothetical protein
MKSFKSYGTKKKYRNQKSKWVKDNNGEKQLCACDGTGTIISSRSLLILTNELTNDRSYRSNPGSNIYLLIHHAFVMLMHDVIQEQRNTKRGTPVKKKNKN